MKDNQIQKLTKRSKMTVPKSEETETIYQSDKRLVDLQYDIHGNTDNGDRAINDPIEFVSKTSRRAVVFLPNDKTKPIVTFKSLTELREATGESNNKIFGKGVNFKHHGEPIKSKLSNMKGVFIGQTPNQVAKLIDNVVYTEYDKNDFVYKKQEPEALEQEPENNKWGKKSKKGKRNRATKS